MAYYIKRVRHERTTFKENESWMFQLIPPFDPSSVSVPSLQINSYIPPKRKPLDVVRNTTEHYGWSTYVPVDLPRLDVPAFAQENLGYVMPRGKRLSVLRDAPHKDDMGWLAALVLAGGYSAANYPAMQLLTNSFRTPRAPRAKRRTSSYGGSVDLTADQITPALLQLLGSYRMPQARRFLPWAHNWLDDLAAVTLFPPTNVPYDTASFAAIRALAESGWMMPKSRLAKRGHELFWQSHIRTFAVIFEVEALLIGIWDQQLHSSYRTPDKKKLNWSHILSQPDIGIIVDPAITLVEHLVATFALAEQHYWNYKRKPYIDALHGFNDLGAWAYPVTVFQSYLWPALEASMQSFRMLDRKKLDLWRNLDVPLDGSWLFTEPNLYPLYAVAMLALTQSFRTPSARFTHDLLRSETIHDLSWLHDVIPVVDGPSYFPRAHWRDIAAAVRSHHRRRRRK